jgi:hypothetical protein
MRRCTSDTAVRDRRSSCCTDTPRTGATRHRVAPRLVGAGSTVISPDLRGYGRSTSPAPTADHSAHSERAVAGEPLEHADGRVLGVLVVRGGPESNGRGGVKKARAAPMARVAQSTVTAPVPITVWRAASSGVDTVTWLLVPG